MRWIFVLFVVVGTTLAQLECPGCAPTTYTVDDLNCDFDPVPLEKFVEPLPDLQLIRGEWDPTMNYPLYKLNMAAGFHKLHPDLPETKMWMYNGIFPGPLFDIESWQKVHIEISNNLPIDNGTNPESPMLPINDPNTRPADRAVVHLHGSVSKPQYCGHPMDWVRPLPGKNVYVNYHANQQSAGTLWYHDHAQGITAPNVYTGLSGIYLLRDEHERSLDLPRKEYEIVLHIADRNVNLETGQLIFDENRGHTTDPFQVVNGKIWPYRDVEPGRYRFRILNASNHRFYNFTFSNNMDFWQIGVDQGFLERAVKVKYLFLGSAERADIIVDFKEAAEKKVELLNTAGRQIFPVFSPSSQLCSDGTVMQFRVGKTAKNSANHGKIPTKKMFDYQDNYPDLEDARVRKINLKLDFTTFQFLINDTPFRGRPDPVIPLGDTEVWEFINAVPSSHPMHVHMVGFYVVDRQPFNATLFAQNQLGDNNVVYTGPARKPPPTERGVKDVAVIFPNEVLRIAATFGPYPGEFVYHCHLLEHEDNDMMRRFAVGPVGPDCQWDADETDEDCSYYD